MSCSVRARSVCFHSVPGAGALSFGRNWARLAGNWTSSSRSYPMSRLRALSTIWPFASRIAGARSVGQGCVQPGDATGDTRGEVPDETLVGRVAGRIQIHVVRRSSRRGFAIVERQYLARGAAVHDESAATDVAGVGENDLEREGDGNGGVDRIAALLQNLHSGQSRERMSS